MKYALLDLKKLLFLPSYRYTAMVIVLILSFMNFLPLFRGSEDLSWANMLTDSFGMILFLTSLGMIITTAQFISGEYINRTAQMNLASGISRAIFILGKAFAIIKATYLMVVITSFIAMILAIFVTLLLGKFDPADGSMFHIMLSLLLSPLKIMPFIFIAFFMTIVLRSSIFPVAFLMLYSTLGELLLTAMLNRTALQKMLYYLPGEIGTPIESITTNKISFVQNTAALERIARESGALPVSPTIGIIGVLLYIVVITLLSYMIFSRQDLSR